MTVWGVVNNLLPYSHHMSNYLLESSEPWPATALTVPPCPHPTTQTPTARVCGSARHSFSWQRHYQSPGSDRQTRREGDQIWVFTGKQWAHAFSLGTQEVETDLEMGRQWWKQAGVMKNGKERGRRPVWHFFNVTFDKNPRLSGQWEASLFFKLRIQHEAIVCPKREGQCKDKQSQKFFIPAPLEERDIIVHKSPELQTPRQRWHYLCLSQPLTDGVQDGSGANTWDSGFNWGCSTHRCTSP